MREIWKDVKNYEELYQVSNLGNVKSKERILLKSNGKVCSNILKKEKILKKNIRQGYYAVKLYKNGNAKNIPIHRLVAETFIINLENKPCINHKDGNKLNNNIENLEWCTYSENTLHAYKIGLSKISDKQRQNGRKVYKLGNEKTSKKINQYDLNGKFIKQYNSIAEANRNFGKSGSRIIDVCKNRAKQCMGYFWQYSE